jgi:hypothetical protein
MEIKLLSHINVILNPAILFGLQLSLVIVAFFKLIIAATIVFFECGFSLGYMLGLKSQKLSSIVQKDFPEFSNLKLFPFYVYSLFQILLNT